jgi:Trk K+ transport system NAD-binding subunit
MKAFVSYIMALRGERELRRNLRGLLKLLTLLTVVVGVYSVLFHVIMLRAEGREHSWITGVYWTLTVMSTLGFGDITFESDTGRLFSIVVLVSGVVLLLIVLPFAFIRLVYAPWLEAQLRLRAPGGVPPGTKGHVVICERDALAEGLVRHLSRLGIPCFFLERDRRQAAILHAEGAPVIAGDPESEATWGKLAVGAARCIVANLDDATNTNVTLTVREIAPDVPVVAVVESEDSLDILELSGAGPVFALKHRLGEQLANRTSAGHVRAHVVGRFRDLLIAELPVHGTPLAGRTVRETALRELTGASVVACWERGRLLPAYADMVFSEHAVAVVIGTPDQVEYLDAMFVIYKPNENPVLVIGGGRVGQAAARALKAQGVPVHLVERDAGARAEAGPHCDRVFAGDAADRATLMAAGLDRAPSVLLTTNDDATNIYLAIYCRRLNPDLRIVSRITHERNLEAIHRAGADVVLSYTSLGVRLIVSQLLGRELVVLGEGADLFLAKVPRILRGRTLRDSGIGARTGLNVIAIQMPDGATVSNPAADAVLPEDAELVMLGTAEQRKAFAKLYR